MGAPQIAIILLFGFNILYVWRKDGQPKWGTYSVMDVIVDTALVVSLLALGGFWGK